MLSPRNARCARARAVTMVNMPGMVSGVLEKNPEKCWTRRRCLPILRI